MDKRMFVNSVILFSISDLNLGASQGEREVHLQHCNCNVGHKIRSFGYDRENIQEEATIQYSSSALATWGQGGRNYF